MIEPLTAIWLYVWGQSREGQRVSHDFLQSSSPSQRWHSYKLIVLQNSLALNVWCLFWSGDMLFTHLACQALLKTTITPAAAGDVHLNHLDHSNSHTFLLGQKTAVFADVHKNLCWGAVQLILFMLDPPVQLRNQTANRMTLDTSRALTVNFYLDSSYFCQRQIARFQLFKSLFPTYLKK